MKKKNKVKLRKYAQNQHHSSENKENAKMYYKKNKETFQEHARDCYRDFSEDGKRKKYVQDCYITFIKA